MWIGTALGLNTVDKNEVRTYLHEKNDPYSLPGNVRSPPNSMPPSIGQAA